MSQGYTDLEQLDLVPEASGLDLGSYESQGRDCSEPHGPSAYLGVGLLTVSGVTTAASVAIAQVYTGGLGL